jgi:hypothetical protein
VLYALNLYLEKIGVVKDKFVTEKCPFQPKLLVSCGVFFNHGVHVVKGNFVMAIV